jgi:hypothetical protein
MIELLSVKPRAKKRSEEPRSAAPAPQPSPSVGTEPRWAAVSTAAPFALGAPVQRKPVIGRRGEPFERQADRVADQVAGGLSIRGEGVSRLGPGGLGAVAQRQEDEEEDEEVSATPAVQVQEEGVEQEEEEEPVQAFSVQRQEEVEEQEEEEALQPLTVLRQEEAGEEHEEEHVQALAVQRAEDTVEEEREAEDEPVQLGRQRRGGGGSTAAMQQTAARAIRNKGAGVPLLSATRRALETRMGVDLSEVRVHQNVAAQDAAAGLNARAFAHGRDIWLGSGESQHNIRLMAHETTHVLQQDGIVRRMPAGVLQSGEEADPHTPTADHAGVKVESGATVGSPQTVLQEERAGAGPRAAAEALPEPAAGALPGARIEGEAGTSDAAGAAREGGMRPSEATSKPEAEEVQPDSAEARARAAGMRATGPAESDAVPPAAAHLSRSPGALGSAEGITTEVAATAGGVAPAGSAADVVEKLRHISPVRAPFVFDQVLSATRQTLSERHSAEAGDPPAGSFRPSAPAVAGKGAAAPAVEATPEEVHADLPGLNAPLPAPKSIQPHEHAGTAPEVRGVEDPGRHLDRIDEENESGFFAWLRHWLSRFINAIPVSDRGVSTELGAAPPVELTGRSDPSQTRELRTVGRSQVEQERAESERERTLGYGEDELSPEMDEEELEAPLPEYEAPARPGCAPENEVERLDFDPEHEQELAERVNPQLADQYEAQRDHIAETEAQRDERIIAAREHTQRTIQTEHADAHRRQSEVIEDAQTQVGRLKEDWEEENEQVVDDYEDESDQAETETHAEIEEHREGEQDLITRHYERSEERAEAERQRVEEQAREARREADRDSGNWFTRGARWVRNKARATFQAVTRKIKGWFEDLRARVKKWFEEAKAWAIDRIEAFRDWAIQKLEGFRNRLNGLVDKYLSRFPRIANAFKRAINSTVDAAQSAVDAGAEALKRAVSFYLDALAFIIDKHLAFAEAVITTGLEVLCHLTVLGLNLIILAVDGDLDALIELIEDLPEPAVLGPLWPVVKAALVGYLERLRDKPADEKKRFVEKTRWLFISPAYHAGVLLGTLKGIVWDGLIGTLRLLYDLVIDIPQAISELYNFFARLMTDVEAINEIIAAARQVHADLDAFLKRPDAAEQVVAFLRRSPEAFFAMVREANAVARGWARRAGAQAADALYSFVLRSSHFEMGMAVGTIIGQVIFEILLLVFTSGIGTAIKVGAKALQLLARGLRLLTQGLARGGRMVLSALRGFQRVAQAGLQAARRLGGALRGIFARLEVLLNRVVAWFLRAFGRFRGKKPVRPARRSREEIIFQSFKRRVNTSLAPFRQRGIARSDLSRILTNHRRPARIRSVVLNTIIRQISRLRYRVQAVVRHTPAPRRVATVKRLPTGGKRSEAIPFVWYKPVSIYPTSLPLTARNPTDTATWDNPPPAHPVSVSITGSATVQVPRRQRIRPGPFSGRATIPLGVVPVFLPFVGKAMRRRRATGTGVRGGTVGALRTLLRNYNYDTAARGEQVDHVQDLAYSGSDTVGNLWPLSDANNQAAKNRTNQSQRVTYQERGDERTAVPNNLIGKWFKIRATSSP